MKKHISCLILLTLVISLFTGCGQTAEAEPTAFPETAAAAEELSPIRSVDELLGALGSDREITLAPGTYDLTTALSCGKDASLYHWDPVTKGLQLQDLHDLTIYGNGAEILLSHEPGGPLTLDGCTNLHIEGLTLTQGKDRALDPSLLHEQIGALALRECRDVTLDGLTLRAPVPVLLSITGSQNVTLTDSLLTEGTGTGISILGCENITVDACRLENIVQDALAEDQAPGMPNFTALIDIGSWNREDGGTASKNITIQKTAFRENRTGLLAYIQDSRKVYIQDNLFTGNHMAEAAFCIWTAQPHIFGNTFEGNDPWLWYYPSSSIAVDENGADIPSELFYAEEKLPEAGPQQEIHVSTAQEFLNAIGPDTKIILDCPLLDLSTAPDYGKGKSDYYFWQEAYDGPVLVITGVNNLTITGDNEDRTAHTISAVPRYADVLSFEFCTNVTLEDLTCGHTVEPGFCMGGVLRFTQCRNASIVNCGLYGCGILGVIARGGQDLSILQSDIYECSDGGVSIVDVSGVTIDRTTFRDLGGEALHLKRCDNALMDGKPIPQD